MAFQEQAPQAVDDWVSTAATSGQPNCRAAANHGRTVDEMSDKLNQGLAVHIAMAFTHRFSYLHSFVTFFCY